MELIHKSFDILLHFDVYLNTMIQHSGLWSYLILFTVIFAETGFVVTPFLPGDSLLFVLGTFSAKGAFNPVILTGTLMLAAIAGDSINYAIGKYFGDRLIRARNIPFFNKEHLDKTHHFYKKYGGKTIILARFIPVVRTFAPFVAGIAHMDYVKFFTYNVVGGIAWVAIFVLSGYFFGNIPFIKENLSLVVLVIIIISIIPGVIEYLKYRITKNKGVS
ncbi:MAG: DedA family protein [Candidatus Omnitrophota bacterium]